MNAEESVRRHSNTEKIAELFKARPNVWINSRSLERPGGRNAWRTRVSDCRREFGMWIENRVLYIKRGGITVAVHSVYCFRREGQPLGRSADMPSVQPSLLG